MASARSIPAVIPAEVHSGSSTMKMRSSSTFTFGNRVCKSRARFQCVVARRPSSRPAPARIKAPVQVAAARRHRSEACRANSITPRVDGSVPRPTISVSKTVASNGSVSPPVKIGLYRLRQYFGAMIFLPLAFSSWLPRAFEVNFDFQVNPTHLNR
jgi:hypothetical protein